MTAVVSPVGETQVGPHGCRGTVTICAACSWRGDQYLGRPCHRCGGEVIGRPCERYPSNGTNVCTSHGAAAPQVRAKARRRLAEDKAERALRRQLENVDVETITDPVAELYDLASELKAWKQVCANQVADLERWRYSSDQGAEQMRTELGLWERSQERLGKVLTDIVKLGLEHMRIALTQQQQQLVAAVFASVKARMDLPTEQSARFDVVVGEELARASGVVGEA